MFVEQRIYTLKPGRVSEYLVTYAARGLAVQSRHLGPPVGYYSSEIGDLNQIVHMWAYSDLLDRQTRRAALFEDPEWLAVVPDLYALIDRMENRVLQPTWFFESSLDGV